MKGSCCPPTALPFIPEPADYVPRGETVLLEGMECYVAKFVDAPKRALVILPEIMGFAGRIKVITDAFADQGFFAVAVNVMRGKHIDIKDIPTLDMRKLPEFFAQFPDEVVAKDMDLVYEYIHKKTSPLIQIGHVGFCWGTYVGMYENARGKVAASGGCHPSHSKICPLMGKDPVVQVEQCKGPVILLTAGDDDPAMQPGGVQEKIMRERTDLPAFVFFTIFPRSSTAGSREAISPTTTTKRHTSKRPKCWWSFSTLLSNRWNKTRNQNSWSRARNSSQI